MEKSTETYLSGLCRLRMAGLGDIVGVVGPTALPDEFDTGTLRLLPSGTGIQKLVTKPYWLMSGKKHLNNRCFTTYKLNKDLQ